MAFKFYMYTMPICFLLISGCAQNSKEISSSRLICDAGIKEKAFISNLDISLYSDQHGSYVTLAQCPERGFGVDYSQTEISRDANSKIARQMRINAAFGGAPLYMTVAGSYEPSKEPDLREKIIIRRIVKYVENPNPYEPK